MPGGPDRPRLFQVREQRRHFLGPFLLVIALHALVISGLLRTRPAPQPKPPVRVVLKLPVRKVAVNDLPEAHRRTPPVRRGARSSGGRFTPPR